MHKWAGAVRLYVLLCTPVSSLSFCTLAQHSILSIFVPLKLKIRGCPYIRTPWRSACYQFQYCLYSLFALSQMMWYFTQSHGRCCELPAPLVPRDTWQQRAVQQLMNQPELGRGPGADTMLCPFSEDHELGAKEVSLGWVSPLPCAHCSKR